MKIDSSRYTAFWSNPERYRLRECWKLSPIEPTAGTFASLMTYGRRRGTCFHELLDAAHKGISEFAAIEELKAAGFAEKEIQAAKRMAAAVRETYPNEEILTHETLFEVPIPDSEHSMVGRIDSVIRRDEEVLVADWKTSKERTKKEMQYKGEEYCRSAQVAFYLVGATQLGFTPNRFLYRLVEDRKNGVEIHEHFTRRTNLELKNFMRGVAMTCDIILFLKEQFGIERPWPCLLGPFDGDYLPIIGQKMYENFIPEGFEPKKEHLSLMAA